MVGCSSSSPVPTLHAPEPTPSSPTSTVVPNNSAKPAPSPTPRSGAALKAELSGAGFTCNSGDNFNCTGTDNNTGNSYSISITVAGASIGAFSLLVSPVSSAISRIDKSAASAYLGSILDAITGMSGGAAQIQEAFSSLGTSWLLGPYLVVSVAPGVNSLGLSGELASQLASKIIKPASSFGLWLIGRQYVCAPPIPDSGYSRSDCASADGTLKLSYLAGEDDVIYGVTLKALALAPIEAVLAILFLPADAGSLTTWLTSASNGDKMTFGGYAISLTRSSGYTLVIATPKS
jgi:hypothetical protein